MLELVLISLFILFLLSEKHTEKKEKKVSFQEREEYHVASPYRPLYSEDFHATLDMPVYNVL